MPEENIPPNTIVPENKPHRSNFLVNTVILIISSVISFFLILVVGQLLMSLMSFGGSGLAAFGVMTLVFIVGFLFLPVVSVAISAFYIKFVRKQNILLYIIVSLIVSYLVYFMFLAFTFPALSCNLFKICIFQNPPWFFYLFS